MSLKNITNHYHFSCVIKASFQLLCQPVREQKGTEGFINGLKLQVCAIRSIEAKNFYYCNCGNVFKSLNEIKSGKV